MSYKEARANLVKILDSLFGSDEPKTAEEEARKDLELKAHEDRMIANGWLTQNQILCIEANWAFGEL